jgi:hypothetical protein
VARQCTRASAQYISASASFSIGAPLTIAAWVYPDTVAATMWPLTIQPASGSYYGIVVLADGTVRVQADDGGGASLAGSATGTVTAGSWQHLCAVLSGGNFFIYHNGTQVGSNAYSEGLMTASNVHAGRLSLNTDYWNGRIAEVAVWTAAITAGEIAALARGTSPLRAHPAGLEVYWPLYGNNSPEEDLSRNARHGTITGGAAAASHSPSGPPVPFVG